MKTLFSYCVALVLTSISIQAQDLGDPDVLKYTAGRTERLQSLNEAKFGLFIHWGPYAVPAGEWHGERIRGLGEWIMFNAEIPVAEYEEMARDFNPEQFDADTWVKLAKNAGMRYIVITAKHCDGFAMYDSEVSEYNIVDWTAYGQDPLAALRKACDRHGVKLGFYYSHWWDWHEANAQGLSNTWDFPDVDKKNPDIYLDRKSLPQVRELVRKYDPYIIWFDVPSGRDGAISPVQSYAFLKTIRETDPDIIINDRIGNKMGDYDTPEQYIPSKTSTFEVCMTLNDTWGYKYYDHNWKSIETVIHNLVDIAHKGGNYLLNIGPTAEGNIPVASMRILQEVGKWMDTYGESIYGTTASPIGDLPFNGRCTARPGKLYIHMLDWPEADQIVVPKIGVGVDKIYLLGDPTQRGLSFKQLATDVIIDLPATQLPEEALHACNTVLVIAYSGDLEMIAMPVLVDPAQVTILTPDDAVLSGGDLEYAFHNVWDDLSERGYHLDKWHDTKATASWGLRAIRKGTYDVHIKYGAPPGCSDNVYEISLAGQKIRQSVSDTGGWYTYQSFNAGTVSLDESDALDLVVKPVKLGGCALMNLKEIQLVPVIK
jgi:alpha-L-fucosidase